MRVRVRVVRVCVCVCASADASGRQAAATDEREASNLEDLRELERDVRLHVVVRRVLGVRCVDVEARACARVVSRAQTSGRHAASRTGAKVPVGVLALDARAARRGVREEDRDACLGRGAEEGAFLRSVRGVSAASGLAGRQMRTRCLRCR
jgi:hypothetical protein